MTSIPWTPDDDDARRLLKDRIESYDVDPAAMSWWERALAWLNDALSLNVDASSTGSIVIQGFLVIAVALLIFFLVRFFRPNATPKTHPADAHLVDPSIAAARYLEQARQLLATGQLDQAYVQAYRAMVQTAVERQLTEVTPSTTATVFGWALGSVLPSYRTAIRVASEQFNNISYGDAVPSSEATESMVHLATTVGTAHPTAAESHSNPARLMPR